MLHCLRFRRIQLIPILVLLALVSIPFDASAQYFGRNKVRWEDFDWRVLKTEHFDIYHYPEEERAVRDAARMAERWYGRLSSVFQREFRERKSIVLYADHSDFQQTTVIGGLISQGTGGVTEGMKTRVVLPLTGNYEETDHVLGHELVHVFQYDILQEPRTDEGGRVVSGGGGANIPLWFIEGLAEYLSLGRESVQTSMWLRDALARDAVPSVEDLSRDPRLFPYRWGHAFWAYVGGRWGDEAVGRLFTRGVRIGFEPALAEVLGVEMKTLSEDWRNAIRQTYAPVLERRQPPTAVGTRILPREGEPDDIYISPVLSPDGRQVAFLSTRNLFTFDLYVADAVTGEVGGRLVSEDSDPHFESLRFLDSAGTWSPDGTKLAFVVLARGDNEIAVIDVRSRRIERRYNAEGVGGMWNPTWSPDGRSIAFSGSEGGITDLYLVDVESGQVRRLTDDIYADLQPEWAPDGRSLVFVSDRGQGSAPNADPTRLTRASMGIWRIEVAGGRVSEVVPAEGTIERGNRFNPKFGPGGRDLYFLSDGAGVTDLYRMAVDSGEIFRVTRLTTGVTGIGRLSPALTVAERSGRVMFSIFENADYRIHSLEPAQARGEPVVAEAARGEEARAAQLPPLGAGPRGLVASYLADTEPLPQLAEPEVTDYRRRLQLDFIGPAVGVGYSTLGTTVGGDVTAYFSDTLGEHEVGVSIFGGTGDFDEFGAQGYYLNQENRLQWGAAGGHIPYVSAFTTAREGIVDIDGQPTRATIYEQIRETVTQDQALLLTRYPFSINRRVEANVGVTRLDFESEVQQLIVVGGQVIDDDEDDLPAPPSLQLYQAGFALVGDNSYFGFTSPVRGWRYRFEVEPTFGDLEFQSVTLDYRRYFFARPVTFAVRGLHFGRYGNDAESGRLTPLYVGRPNLIRGYEIGDINLSECSVDPNDPGACPEFDRLVGSRVGVLNFELRFPLVGTEGFGLFRTRFLPVELGLFVDAGTAWTEDATPELRFEEDSLERVPVVSAGLSARLLLGGFAVLHFYAAKPFQRPQEDWVTGFFISPGW
jgi:hypothetical protein